VQSRPATAPTTCEIAATIKNTSYIAAMSDVMTETMEVRIDEFENLAINGDNATADASFVIGTGGKTNYTTDVTQFALVKEDGRWKDCTPPDQTE
jgi:hypothetical protein